MTGRFIAVVGPSGVGKDSVMRAVAAAAPNFVLARRVITRPSNAGGEDFTGVTEEVFTQMVRDDAFVLSWPAHGLRYGIPQTVLAELASGRDVLANLSRKVLPQAKVQFPSLEVILLSAAPQALAARLKARGREDPAEIERRLAQADFEVSADLHPHHIDNSGPWSATVRMVLAALQPTSAAR